MKLKPGLGDSYAIRPGNGVYSTAPGPTQGIFVEWSRLMKAGRTFCHQTVLYIHRWTTPSSLTPDRKDGSPTISTQTQTFYIAEKPTMTLLLYRMSQKFDGQLSM